MSKKSGKKSEALAAAAAPLDAAELRRHFPKLSQPLAEMLAAMRRSDTGVVVKDRRYHLKKYKRCFIASEAVTWTAGFMRTTRPLALAALREMMDCGGVYHVHHEHHFEDDFLFFRFAESIAEAFPKDARVASAHDEIGDAAERSSSGGDGSSSSFSLRASGSRTPEKRSHRPTLLADLPPILVGTGAEVSSRLLPLLDQLKGRVPVKNRRYLARTYRDVFLGSEAVDHLMGICGLTNRVQVQLVGQAMLKRGWLLHVMNKHQFEDSGLFYRFTGADLFQGSTATPSETSSPDDHSFWQNDASSFSVDGSSGDISRVEGPYSAIPVNKQPYSAIPFNSSQPMGEPKPPGRVDRTNTMYLASSFAAWSIHFEDLKLGPEIARGAFGVCLRGEWRSTPCAIKQLLSDDPAAIEEFEIEVEILKMLRPHTNLVALLGVASSGRNSPLSVVMELMEGGSLWKLLDSARLTVEKNPGALTREQQIITTKCDARKRILIGICRGLLHLHSEGVVHRDLAARNVLLTQELTPKIADLGLSRILLPDETTLAQGDEESPESSNRSASNYGPLKWLAPECINRREYSKASDIWSLSCLFLEVITQRPPYGFAESLAVATRVGAGELRPVFTIEANSVGPGIYNVIGVCCEHSPAHRPTAETVVAQLAELSEV